eukprot:Gb_39283 [translate_table: standard]
MWDATKAFLVHGHVTNMRGLPQRRGDSISQSHIPHILVATQPPLRSSNACMANQDMKLGSLETMDGLLMSSSAENVTCSSHTVLRLTSSSHAKFNYHYFHHHLLIKPLSFIEFFIDIHELPSTFSDIPSARPSKTARATTCLVCTIRQSDLTERPGACMASHHGNDMAIIASQTPTHVMAARSFWVTEESEDHLGIYAQEWERFVAMKDRGQHNLEYLLLERSRALGPPKWVDPISEPKLNLYSRLQIRKGGEKDNEALTYLGNLYTTLCHLNDRPNRGNKLPEYVKKQWKELCWAKDDKKTYASLIRKLDDKKSIQPWAHISVIQSTIWKFKEKYWSNRDPTPQRKHPKPKPLVYVQSTTTKDQVEAEGTGEQLQKDESTIAMEVPVDQAPCGSIETKSQSPKRDSSSPTRQRGQIIRVENKLCHAPIQMRHFRRKIARQRRGHGRSTGGD